MFGAVLSCCRCRGVASPVINVRQTCHFVLEVNKRAVITRILAWCPNGTVFFATQHTLQTQREDIRVVASLTPKDTSDLMVLIELGSAGGLTPWRRCCHDDNLASMCLKSLWFKRLFTFGICVLSKTKGGRNFFFFF